MLTKEEWQQQVFKTYEKIRSHKEPYKISVKGIEIEVLPNVFSPKYFADSAWFAKEVPTIVGKSSLLEIGTGTGIVAIFCAMKGAKVVATDISPDAIRNAKLNAEKQGLDISVREGSVYEPIKPDEKFDFIFWNHPFNNWQEPVDDVLLMGGFDYNYHYLEEYISGARNHLSENGRLLLGTGNFSDLDSIQKISDKNGFEMVLLKETTTALQPGTSIMNKFLLYQLKSKE